LKPLSWFPFLLAGLTLLPLCALGEEGDPGLIRALETDSASVENAYYLWAVVDNDTAPYHYIYLYGEGVAALAKDWGLEVDFPNLDTWDPLGRYPLVLAPIGLYLRYEALHSGSWSSETGYVLSFQAGAAYEVPQKTFEYLGSSWSVKVLAGYKLGMWFAQGNYGFQGGIDPDSLTQFTANTGLGYSLGSNWYLQAEADFYDITAPSNAVDSDWTFLPQVAFQPGDWLFELGEAFNDDHPQGLTEILAARTF
jgi:hypothetical protein